MKVDLGTEGSHLFEIVAFDTDDLADGSGKAKITWMSKNIVQKVTTPKDTTNGYLQNTILPLMPTNVRSAIASVTKLNGSSGSTENLLWAPNYYEICAASINADTKSGAQYSGRFSQAEDRIKKLAGAATKWYTRSNSNNYYYYVMENGSGDSSRFSNNQPYGLVFGFCT